jgi:hypothetical protein
MPGIGIGISPALKRHNGTSLPVIVPIGLPTSDHVVLGDSLSTNPYAYATAPNLGYTGLFNTAKSITANNQAVSGAGIYIGVDRFFQNTPFPNTKSGSICMGLNDARASSLGEDVTMAIGGLSTILANHYGKTYYNLASTATPTGTWYNIGGSMPVRRSGNVYASFDTGDTLTKTFNGDAIAIKTQIQDVGTGCRGFTIHIDGVLKYTFDPSVLYCNSVTSQPNGVTQFINPYTIILSGLGAGAHTCLITVTAGNGTYACWLDSLIELQPYASVSLTKPFCLIEVPRLNATGYTVNAPLYNKASNTSINALNSGVWASPQITYFKGYTNFGRVETNSYYDPNDPLQVNPDNIHFWDLGSYKVAQPVIQIFN